MKKMIAAAAILSMAAVFAGCSAKNDSSAASQTESTSEAVSENSSVTTETSSAEADSSAADNTPSTDGSADSTTDTNDSTTDSTTETDPEIAGDSRAAMYAEAVLGAANWPDMELISGETAEAAYSFTGIDLSLCEDYYFALPYTSVDLARIIIVKPAEGNEDEVKSQVEAHFDYIKTSAADYPTQEAAVSGSVSGVTSDGYYYIIVSENGAAAADAIAAMEV
ncbi:MAG: DUF4358 domain-containing protein [Oscillospiraceae bacterium]